MSITQDMRAIAANAKASAYRMAGLSTESKNRSLLAMADALQDQQSGILAENQKDVDAGQANGLNTALLDRLQLTEARFQSMADGLRQVAALPDPVGRILDERSHASGLKLRKITAPLGVIVIIYESRPNVTADAAGLCFKSGNVTILRGGKEAIHSNRIIAKTMMDAARARLPEFPEHAIQVVPTTDRAAIPELLALTEYVDLCIPRGGEGLIRAVAECSRVPVIKHYKGICNLFIDSQADPDMARAIAVNAKTQRPGVCNAIENLLIARDAAPQLLPPIAQALLEKGVELRADPEALSILADQGLDAKPATDEDWDEEYLDLILSIKLVATLDEAVAFINEHGSSHSDAIVTRDAKTAERFMNEVDSASVYWNASTRFTDGGEFGMGAEIGISTDKIGARGPMGLAELTTYKWLGIGEGQVRS